MGIKLYKYIPTIIWLIGIFIASFMSSSSISPKLYLFPHQDKIVHGCMYFGLAFLFLWNSRNFFAITSKFFIITVIAVSALSGAIEILQPILSSRTADFADFVANSLGALLGGTMVFFYHRKKNANA